MELPRAPCLCAAVVPSKALPVACAIIEDATGRVIVDLPTDTVVQADDHVVLFIADRRHVDQVERLFLGETAGRR